MYTETVLTCCHHSHFVELEDVNHATDYEYSKTQTVTVLEKQDTTEKNNRLRLNDKPQ